jgi:hypothetical protein
MASNSNGGDAIKKSKSSTNENNYNNKNFSQKLNKKGKGSAHEKASAMEASNGKADKSSEEEGESPAASRRLTFMGFQFQIAAGSSVHLPEVSPPPSPTFCARVI